MMCVRACVRRTVFDVRVVRWVLYDVRRHIGDISNFINDRLVAVLVVFLEILQDLLSRR